GGSWSVLVSGARLATLPVITDTPVPVMRARTGILGSGGNSITGQAREERQNDTALTRGGTLRKQSPSPGQLWRRRNAGTSSGEERSAACSSPCGGLERTPETAPVPAPVRATPDPEGGSVRSSA